MEPALFANAFVMSRPFVTVQHHRRDHHRRNSRWRSRRPMSTWTEEMQKAVDAIHQRVGNPCP